ncbi:hypothetical protein WG66_006735 [Moniliophthora roreri]|nr:hypothetical protein WG66_006735 [Moniliophthora roreri]
MEWPHVANLQLLKSLSPAVWCSRYHAGIRSFPGFRAFGGSRNVGPLVLINPALDVGKKDL